MTTRRRLSWLVMVAVLAGVLAVGVLDDDGDQTPAERAATLHEQFACPVCDGQSVAESNVGAAAAIRADIDRRVADGQSDQQIEAYLISVYGEEIVLTPSSDGVAALVWAMPVVGAVLAVGGLVVVFRGWSRRGDVEVSDADRELVERALQEERG
ncbi:MAG: cytochrome c-type biogenesis protein CcmH [Actinomycetota bacterium]|nr:cytochrome c-type biogenesis protein CcmH [Actinomycetota bacterium]